MQPSKSIDIKNGSFGNTRSNHRRNQSWPPIQVQVTPPPGTVPSRLQANTRLRRDDTEDPWAYFVTPAVDDDFLYDSGDTEQATSDGGIATPPNIGHPFVRNGHEYVFKQSLAERWDSFITKRQELAKNPPHRYVDKDEDSDEDDETYIWPNTVEAEILDRTPSPDPHHRRPKSLTDAHDPYREHRERRARKKYKRTLSGHRHSWHEPSPDLFPVSETASEYRADDDLMSLDDSKPMSRSAVELGQRAKL